MSWFDTSGLTSLAKSALKEAQKTIDKALDIQQDGIERRTSAAVQEKSLTDPTPTPVKEGDFFSTWGLTSSDSINVNNTISDQPVVTQSPSKVVSQSLWGSFTGSFFETGGTAERYEGDKDVKPQLEMIVDDSSEVGTEDEPFSKSKLVVHGMSEDSEGGSVYSRLNSDNDKESITDVKQNYENAGITHFEGYQDLLSGSKYEVATVKNYSAENFPVTLRRSSDRQATPFLNRLSIISSESGMNSSESIEILGSQSLKTTPDSEIASLNRSASASSSNGVKVASSSVEVLPESLMSPSSIEFLGFNSHSEDLSRASDEEFCSPVTSPIDDDNSSIHTKINSKASTDEDIKVIADVNIPGNDDEDVSAADDTISYNSISEFTTPTVLDSSNVIKNVDLFPTIKQYSNEMMDSFGSDLSGGHPRSLEDMPITRAPSRNTTQFATTHPASIQTFLSKDYGDKIPMCSSNIIHMENIQPLSHNYQSSLINDSYASSNEGSWSDRTLNAESEGAGMESSTEDTAIKKSVSSDKSSTSYYVTGMLEDAIDDKSSDKASDSSSCCKLGESSDLIHPSWKETNFSSSSHSYEEVDKASSIDQMENIPFSHLEFAPREQNSPGSSESRSGDMVKVGSEQTSGHTSGDDLETTTSSDIEIIPSPNGDYGNIYSIGRDSPAKLPMKFSRQSGNIVDLVLGKQLASKIRGHNRELSEASSQSNTSDDSHCSGSETDRLMKRLAEMADILESRESKLIEVSRKNVELLESNSELKICVENLQGKQDMGDVTLITEEYTLRMSALEKKFQQAIRDKDILRKQMETCKQEAATRMTSRELESAVGEKDETIKELREEGEKLSKQQLHHSTIIKKLRTKEKENEQVIKTLRDKVAEQAQELDRLKRSISAKESIECSQIEAVYKLTTFNKKLDSELEETKGLLDDSNQKLDTMKTSLEAARKELIELQRNSTDLVRRQETLTTVEKEKASMELENEHLTYQLEELRIKMRQDEQRWMSREASLRSEVSRQMARAEEAESALQLTNSSGMGSGESGMGAGTAEGAALLAQLTALQESALERDRRAQTREMRLQQSAADAQSKLSKISEKNQLLRDECQTLSTKLTSVESILSKSVQKLDACTTSCEEHMTQLNITLESNERLKCEYNSYKEESTEALKDLKERVVYMEQHLSMEKAACDAEKRRNLILQEQLRDIALSNENQTVPGSSLLLARLVGASSMNASTTFTMPGQSSANNPGVAGTMVTPGEGERTDVPSPPGSTGRDSLASESLGSGIWPLDDGDSCAMGSAGGVGMGEGVGVGGMCALERLQASLQRREGELRAARKAGKRSHAQRTALVNQLALHAAELDTMQSLQHQYDALLQMYGEKEEQLQELRLDLQDVKDMYKMQLDEILMLKRQAAEREQH